VIASIEPLLLPDPRQSAIIEPKLIGLDGGRTPTVGVAQRSGMSPVSSGTADFPVAGLSHRGQDQRWDVAIPAQPSMPTGLPGACFTLKRSWA
jgi:hypothetical protein